MTISVKRNYSSPHALPSLLIVKHMQSINVYISLETTYFLFKVEQWRKWPSIWQPCMWFSQLIKEWMCTCFKLRELPKLAIKSTQWRKAGVVRLGISDLMVDALQHCPLKKDTLNAVIFSSPVISLPRRGNFAWYELQCRTEIQLRVVQASDSVKANSLLTSWVLTKVIQIRQSKTSMVPF